MSAKPKRITAAISEHWLVGYLPLAGTRIQEALNDARTDFVRLSDVEVHSPAKRKCVAMLPEVIVPKCKIEFVIVPESPHEAPEKRWSNYAVKGTFNAFAIVSHYHISGELHLPTKSIDCQYILAQQLGRFFALTRASIGLSRRDVKQLSAPLLFANKDFVSCFHVGEPAQSENGGGGQQSLTHHDDLFYGDLADFAQT